MKKLNKLNKDFDIKVNIVVNKNGSSRNELMIGAGKSV